MSCDIPVLRVLYLGDAVAHDIRFDGSKVETDCSSVNVEVPTFEDTRHELYSAKLMDGRYRSAFVPYTNIHFALLSGICCVIP